MNILESLSSPESRRKFRELVKSYHPDTGHKDDNVIKKINDAKDKGDAAIDRLYAELISGKKSNGSRGYDPDKGYDEFDDDNKKDEELNNIMVKVSGWLKEITSHGMFRALKYTLEIFDFTEDQPRGNPDNIGLLLRMNLDGKKQYIHFAGEYETDTKMKLFTEMLKKYGIKDERENRDQSKHDEEVERLKKLYKKQREKSAFEKNKARIQNAFYDPEFKALFDKNHSLYHLSFQEAASKQVTIILIMKEPHGKRVEKQFSCDIDIEIKNLYDFIENNLNYMRTVSRL